jgi:D-glycero-D-manno-heptose 1,7-bisphosphate phosphatase
LPDESGASPDVGLFAQRLTERPFAGRPGLFLDRDGVLVEEINYLHRPEDVVFISGAYLSIARANRVGVAIVMVTNQAGIARGLYTWDDFLAVQRCIYTHCALHGARFDMVLACAYHIDGIGDYAIANHPWRKPAPGMLLEAARVLEVDLGRSFIIGDSLSDLAAGRAAGLPGGALVRTGHGEREWRKGGEPQFAEWRNSQFTPRHVENAATAIDQWLEDLIARTGAW